MTNLRHLAFAGLTLIASAGTALAAPHASDANSSQYYGYYQNGGGSTSAFGRAQMSDDQGRNDPSCYRGILPWTLQSCGIK